MKKTYEEKTINSQVFAEMMNKDAESMNQFEQFSCKREFAEALCDFIMSNEHIHIVRGSDKLCNITSISFVSRDTYYLSRGIFCSRLTYFIEHNEHCYLLLYVIKVELKFWIDSIWFVRILFVVRAEVECQTIFLFIGHKHKK